MKPLTPSRRRALEILRDHGPIRPREFARVMWPDSPGWNFPAKSGPRGTHRGGGMYLAAGGLLGKLRREGLSSRDTLIGHTLSPTGREALERP